MLAIKTDNSSGIPTYWEIQAFQAKHGLNVNEVPRLYVKFKRGIRRRLKRLHLKIHVTPCELCGYHAYATGKVGGKEFEKELC